MKFFIFIALYVLIAFVSSMLLIAYEYKNDRVFKEVNEFMQYRDDEIGKNLLLGIIWPLSLSILLLMLSLEISIKFILSKVNKEED